MIEIELDKIVVVCVIVGVIIIVLSVRLYMMMGEKKA